MNVMLGIKEFYLVFELVLQVLVLRVLVLQVLIVIFPCLFVFNVAVLLCICTLTISPDGQTQTDLFFIWSMMPMLYHY